MNKLTEPGLALFLGEGRLGKRVSSGKRSNYFQYSVVSLL